MEQIRRPSMIPAAIYNKERGGAAQDATKNRPSRQTADITGKVASGKPESTAKASAKASRPVQRSEGLAASSMTHQMASGSQAAQQIWPKCCAWDAKNAPSW